MTSTLADVGRRLETAQRALDGAVDDTKAVGKEKEALMQRKSQLQKLGGERRVAESRVAQKRQSLRGLQADAVDLDAEEAKVKRETAVRLCSLRFLFFFFFRWLIVFRCGFFLLLLLFRRR